MVDDVWPTSHISVFFYMVMAALLKNADKLDIIIKKRCSFVSSNNLTLSMRINIKTCHFVKNTYSILSLRSLELNQYMTIYICIMHMQIISITISSA